MTTNYALILTLNYFFEIVNWLIVIRVVLSLLRMENMGNPISRFVIIVTEPILAPFRRLQFKSSIGRNMMIDFSPILAMLAIQYVIRPILVSLISLI
ncbi:YggT family protein [Thermoanaerobacterium saccharolyticum]|uniref:YggT family protein n=1 Tax=Thermoanaerobacterium saccharolyticum TaxID=28896 RepID=UPI0005EE29D6